LKTNEGLESFLNVLRNRITGLREAQQSETNEDMTEKRSEIT